MTNGEQQVPETTDAVRLGVVGLGWFGGVLVDAARRTGAMEVVSCFARSEESRLGFARTHGCAAAPSLEDLLADTSIDAVMLATPHSTHESLIETVTAAGKHVFVEKPLALTVSSARRSIDAAARAGVVLQVGHNRRRDAAVRRIRAMVDAGELGRIIQLDGFHSAAGAYKPDLPAWRTDPDECPAGGMTALGVHTVDTFHYLAGPAAKVVGVSKKVTEGPALDQATAVTVEYESGPLAQIGTSYFVPGVVSFAVYGTDANAWSEEDGRRLFLQTRAEKVRTEVPIDPLDSIVDELAEFARCVRLGTTPETGGPEGLEVAVVLEGITRSLASGGVVDLSELR